ncbi:MAG TPA: phospholipase D-like domain-containing protein [Sphingomicrobium sp.]|nr:phospholipase D-like domain-containing protein [Sphingomicrobium sp.]
MLETGRNCWRIAKAGRASLVVDAADYFRLARQAMLRAKSQILLIGWDFDTRICLDYTPDDDAPTELGAFLSWLPKQRPGLQINILKWNLGAVYLLGRGTTVLRVARWARNKQIHFKLDATHPPGASHHQKIVVIDDALAFCGGIDMTGSRWDTRAHSDDDEHRRRPTTKRHYRPWHDATMAVDGAAAAALGDLSRKRWEIACGGRLPKPAPGSVPWPDELEPHFRDVEVAIARTRAAVDGREAVREIEALFIDMIAGAKRFVYAENQYFASRAVADAICRRLGEPDGPEFVIVNPKTSQGWLDDEVMSPARAELLDRVRQCDAYGRFRMLTPVSEGGEDIYVHSKITIVDDRQFRVGSANLNNRSLGFDSECDVMIDAGQPGNEGASEVISDLCWDLLSEHLGVSVDTVAARFAETGSLVKLVDSFSSNSGRRLVPFIPDKPNKLESAMVESEIFDPESAGDPLEPMARPGLLAGLPKAWRVRRRERPD